MGYKCRFLDNASYTAQDVNSAFCGITGSGTMFSDTGDTLDDFNTAFSELVGAGTQLCGCKAEKDGEKYKIGAGVCFLADGSQIEFDEDGYEFKPIDGEKCYVYIRRNIISNSIDIVVSENECSSEDVPIAEISAEGEITDTRTFAEAKILLKTGQSVPKRTFTLKKSFSYPIGGTAMEYLFHVGYNDWKYILFQNQRLSCSISSSDESVGYRALDLSDGNWRMITATNTATSQMWVRKETGGLRFMAASEGVTEVNLEFVLV